MLQVIFHIYEIVSCTHHSVFSFLSVLGQDETNLALVKWEKKFGLHAYLATLRDEKGGLVADVIGKGGLGEKGGLPLIKGGLWTLDETM